MLHRPDKMTKATKFWVWVIVQHVERQKEYQDRVLFRESFRKPSKSSQKKKKKKISYSILECE